MIRQPSLYIYGAADGLAALFHPKPPTLDELRCSMPGLVDMVRLETGHWIQHEAADRLNVELSSSSVASDRQVTPMSPVAAADARPAKWCERPSAIQSVENKPLHALGDGVYAEYTAIDADADTVSLVPERMALDQAGAMPIVALTALHGLVEVLHLAKARRC